MKGVSIRGLAAALPATRQGPETIRALFGDADAAERTMKATGIRERRVAAEDVTAADLGAAAARRLFDTGIAHPDTIDAVILVCQYPDVVSPATACLLQERLGISERAMCFDVNQGCAGYVHGLAIAGSLISSAARSRALLVVADTPTRSCAPNDRGTIPLFGDAGTATLIEPRDDGSDIGEFVFGNDGRGWVSLTIPVGASRYPTVDAFSRRAPADVASKMYHPTGTNMDGEAVFRFSLERVPPLVSEVLSRNATTMEELDHVVLHQASGLILDMLRRKLRVDPARFVRALDGYGNTASATIPLTIASQFGKTCAAGRYLLVGFGVGLSWSGVCVTLQSTIEIPPVVEI